MDLSELNWYKWESGAQYQGISLGLCRWLTRMLYRWFCVRVWVGSFHLWSVNKNTCHERISQKKKLQKGLIFLCNASSKPISFPKSILRMEKAGRRCFFLTVIAKTEGSLSFSYSFGTELAWFTHVFLNFTQSYMRLQFLTIFIPYLLQINTPIPQV